MEKIDISKMAVAELKLSIQESFDLLFRLQIQKSTQQLKDSNQIKKVRRDIARYKTALCARREYV